MSLPWVFANVTELDTPHLDDNYNALGEFVTVQCTAAGINTLTLTPVTNAPVVSAYGLPYPVRFGFTAPANSTGSVQAAISGLATLNVYLPNLSQAGNGSLTSGSYYEVVYLAALNSGAGGFVIVSAIPSASAAAASLSQTQNLLVTNNSVTPSTKVTITAGRALMITSTGTPLPPVSGVSVTIDLTTGTSTSTANGMDGESRPTSGWLYLYLISNGTTTAGLGTKTAPASGNPTLPTGYIYLAYVGAMYCDGSSNLLRTKQAGPDAQYTVVTSSNVPNVPLMISGASGSTSVPTWTAVSVANFVPPTASAIRIFLQTNNPTTQIIVAPNNSYGPHASTTNPPPFDLSGVTGAGVDAAVPGELILESADIFYASLNSGSFLYCLGWRDAWVR
jgi:hypothetical protein